MPIETPKRSRSGVVSSPLRVVAPINVNGGRSRVTLGFTTLYRQEGSQSARVLASWNGGTPVEVKRYTSDVISQPQALTLDVPAGAANVSFRFHYTGSNNWYWVIDGVTVTAS